MVMSKQVNKSFSRAARNLSMAHREGDRRGFRRARNAMDEAEAMESLTNALDEYYKDEDEYENR